MRGEFSGGGGDSVNNTSPFLVDIAGVWNNSETIDGLTDEVYLVIKTNGTVVFYDYMGDSFDAEANCYMSFTETISDLGGGDFLVGGNWTVHLTISSGNLITTFDGITDPPMPPSSLLESDLAPICDF